MALPESTPPPRPPALAQHTFAVRVALGYALGAALWVAGSDWLLSQLVQDPKWLTRVASAKGWFFVGVTASLLYAVLRRRGGVVPAPVRDGLPPASIWRWPLLLRMAAVLGVTLAVLAFDHGQKMYHQREQIEAVADLRSAEVQAWLEGHMAQAQFARGSRVWADLYRRWADRGDADARDQLMARLSDLRQSFRGHSAWLLDADAGLVATDAAGVAVVPPALRKAALEALGTGEVRHTGLYEPDRQSGSVWLDVVAPLVAGGGPPRAVVVLRVDASTTLLDRLGRWPVPSRTAATLLVRREGDMLVGSRGRLPLPLSTPGNLVARAIRGEVPFGQAVTAADVRGQTVIGAVRPVPGTNWYLAARIDRAEALEPVLLDAV